MKHSESIPIKKIDQNFWTLPFWTALRERRLSPMKNTCYQKILIFKFLFRNTFWNILYRFWPKRVFDYISKFWPFFTISAKIWLWPRKIFVTDFLILRISFKAKFWIILNRLRPITILINSFQICHIITVLAKNDIVPEKFFVADNIFFNFVIFV